jgi:hypothetical protein
MQTAQPVDLAAESGENVRTANPVPVTLTIGDDSGTTMVDAAIFRPLAAGNH